MIYIYNNTHIYYGTVGLFRNEGYGWAYISEEANISRLVSYIIR